MATTNYDLIKDRFIDILEAFNIVCNIGNNGEDTIVDHPIETEEIEKMVDMMMCELTDYGVTVYPATKEEFRIKVIVEKPRTVNTPYGDIIPEENTKQSEVL